MTLAEHARLDEALGDDVELVASEDVVEDGRRVKDDEERELIRRAQAATDAAFSGILDRFALGVSERWIARELERLMLDAGADGLAFDPIVAFGESAAEPHHEPGHRVLEEGDAIKLDIGALVDGYHTDMTRTIAFGQPTAELQKVHLAVVVGRTVAARDRALLANGVKRSFHPAWNIRQAWPCATQRAPSRTASTA